MSKSVSVHVSTYVDVELEDIDTDHLVEELSTRGIAQPENVMDLIREMHDAFYRGKDDRAMVLARQIAEAGTGRMVPAPLRRVA